MSAFALGLVLGLLLGGSAGIVVSALCRIAADTDGEA